MKGDHFMNCPFCGKQMNEGELFLLLRGSSIANYHGEVTWRGDTGEETIKLSRKSDGFYPYFKARKCNECRKLIMEIEEDVEIGKRICPECGASIDYDYPKCPECRHDFYDE